MILLAENVRMNDNQGNRNSLYGIVVFFTSGGSFRSDSALGNGSLDLLWDGTGSLTFSQNTADTASPSKAAWNAG